MTATIIHEIPGLGTDLRGFGRITEDGIVRSFSKEIRAVRTADELTAFVKKWNAIWRLDRDGKKPPHIIELDAKISTLDFDKKVALNCLAFVRANRPCNHAPPWGGRPKPKTYRIRKKIAKLRDGGRICPGMEIRLPWSLSMAVMIAGHYGVPDGVAIHQAFCPGPHDECF